MCIHLLIQYYSIIIQYIKVLYINIVYAMYYLNIILFYITFTHNTCGYHVCNIYDVFLYN